MAISTVASTTATSSSQALQNNKLGVDDFLKVLLTQLTYQDPLKPMDNQQFMAQMAQFTSLEQTQQLNTKLEQLVNNQAALQSVGLIGKTVDISNGNATVTGAVTALSFSGDSPTLTLTSTDGTVLQNIGLSQVLSVR
jgi:flagellar basal-body rod modification protein FlgD